MATSPTAISLPKTALTPNRLAIEGPVELAKSIERVEPVYPPLARQTRVQGTVRLHAIIAIDGSVEVCTTHFSGRTISLDNFQTD